LLERARKNLETYPGEFSRIDLAALRETMATWRNGIGSGAEPPEFPKIRELQIKNINHEGHEVTRRKTSGRT
jgi:hypothetical protein